MHGFFSPIFVVRISSVEQGPVPFTYTILRNLQKLAKASSTRQEALEIGRLLLSVPISENSSVEMKTPRLQDLLEVKSFAVLVHRIHFRSVRDIHEPMTLA